MRTSRGGTAALVVALLAASLVAAAQGSSGLGAVRVAHQIVALADNQYQGIVPVPAAIGNGDDPLHNLYWGGRLRS